LGAQQVTAQTAMGSIFLVANIVIARTTGGYFDAAAETNPLLNTWSLSVEEQFYLVFPLVLLLGWVLRKHVPRIRAFPVVVVAVGSFGLMMLTSRGGQVPFIPGDLVGFYGPLSRAWEFAAGALLALVVGGAGAGVPAGRGAWRLELPPGWVEGLLGAAMLVASLWLIDESLPGPGLRNLLPVVGTVLILRAGAHPANPVSRVLATRPFVALGDVSYSWYLWHWPLIVFAALLWPDRPLVPVAAAIVSLLPSIAWYRWVEQPIRQATVMTQARWARLVAYTLTPPLALSTTLLWVANNGYWNDRVALYGGDWRTAHVSRLAGCFVGLPANDTPPLTCTWNAEATGKPIFLFGDSNADHFSAAVIGAGYALDRPVTVFTVGECPFLDVVPFGSESDKAPDNLCGAYVSRTLAWLDSLASKDEAGAGVTEPWGLVVLSSSSGPWVPEGDVGAVDPLSEMNISADYLEAVLTTTVNELQAMGLEVLLVQPVPHFIREPYDLHYDECSLWRILGEGCEVQMPQAFADRMQGNWRQAVVRAGAATDATILDLRSQFCPDQMCSTMIEGVNLYADAVHVSVAKSEQLIPEFTEAMSRVT
jgi:peptidoglycan/LPS O-acetylase OafA/YrhL